MTKREIGQVVRNEILGDGIITSITGTDMEIFLYDTPYRDQHFVRDDIDNEMWKPTKKPKIEKKSLPKNRDVVYINPHRQDFIAFLYRDI